MLNLPGVGLGAYRDGAAIVFGNLAAPRDVRPTGVEIGFWLFRNGDSGRGRDGRDLGRNAGLAALPRPMDWLNLATDGRGDMYALLSARPPILKAPRDGEAGVAGKESVDWVGEARLKALFKGRKMPAPGMDVAKYRVLVQRIRKAFYEIRQLEANPPFHVAVVLTSGRPLPAKLYTCKHALFALDFAYKFDGPMHSSWHID